MRFALLTLLLPAAVASAGGYGTVRLSADAAGVVRLRGPDVQAVDWHAAGRSAADVPVYVYGDDPGPLTVNDRPSDAAVRFVVADPLPASDEDAYQRAFAWSPGPTPATARWTLGAAGVVTLTLLVARFADPKRATRWTLVTAVGLTAGVAWRFPADPPRRTLNVPGHAGREWVWYAGRKAGAVREPWAAGLRFVPRSDDASRVAGPVLHCDAAGRPTAIECRVEAGGRTVFVRDRAERQ